MATPSCQHAPDHQTHKCCSYLERPESEQLAPWSPQGCRWGAQHATNDRHNGAPRGNHLVRQLLTALPRDAICTLERQRHACRRIPGPPYWAHRAGPSTTVTNGAHWARPLASKPLTAIPTNAILTLSGQLASSWRPGPPGAAACGAQRATPNDHHNGETVGTPFGMQAYNL